MCTCGALSGETVSPPRGENSLAIAALGEKIHR
jgi:hypothetical protein